MANAWDEYIEIESLRRSMASVRLELESVRRALDERKAGFNPNQPRVLAGNPDGGQWTSVGQSSGPRYADASRYTNPLIVSDANPEPIISGAQYAQTQIKIDASALQGISRIDEATVKLTETLASVMDTVAYLPDMSPAAYGTAVHTAFAIAVRAKNFPGIAFGDVETTFGLEDDAPYGSKFSIRTDIVLRNEVGEIVAIYDVKTGGAALTPKRIREIRERTGAADNVPIIEMHVIRGVTRKGFTKSRKYFWIIAVRLWKPFLPDIAD